MLDLIEDMRRPSSDPVYGHYCRVSSQGPVLSTRRRCHVIFRKLQDRTSEQRLAGRLLFPVSRHSRRTLVARPNVMQVRISLAFSTQHIHTLTRYLMSHMCGRIVEQTAYIEHSSSCFQPPHSQLIFCITGGLRNDHSTAPPCRNFTGGQFHDWALKILGPTCASCCTRTTKQPYVGDILPARLPG